MNSVAWQDGHGKLTGESEDHLQVSVGIAPARPQLASCRFPSGLAPAGPQLTGYQGAVTNQTVFTSWGRAISCPLHRHSGEAQSSRVLFRSRQSDD